MYSGDGYPFGGLRVLDFGVGAVGVEVGRLLAEYGADVIKLETDKAPDFMRAVVPGGINPMFASSSRSKRSLGINLKSQRGLELVYALVKGADIMIENNGAGVMERLGLGWEKLRELNPRLIFFESHLVGSRGPWNGWVGYGPSTHPVSGLQHLWNYEEDEERPAGSTNIFPDHMVGRVGALGVVAGLIRRERTGLGMHAESAQFETAIGFLADLFAKESLAPGAVHPQGNTSARGVPWGAYRCAGEDEWCAINVRSDAEWEALRAALGDPEWAREPAYATLVGRRAARPRIDAGLEEWTREREPFEVMDTLQAQGVPAGVLEHPRHVLADPQLMERGYLRPVDQPPLGGLIFEGPAFHGSDLPEPIIGPAPLSGQHTRELCAELLDLSDAEMDQLIADGVLEVVQESA